MGQFIAENNAERIRTLQAEVECLRKVLAEKDKEIKHLKDLLDIYDKNPWSENKVKVIYSEEKEND